MTSRVTPSFLRGLAALSPSDQAAARRAYRQFAVDPFHNSLRFKKLAGHEHLWSVRVTISIRAVAHRDGETVVWTWIGSHNEFDSRFG